jgi:hypothetical protein
VAPAASSRRRAGAAGAGCDFPAATLAAMKPPPRLPEPDERVRRAVELLAEAARERLNGAGPRAASTEPLALALRLPLAGGAAALAESAAALQAELDAELRAAVAARALCPPGHVVCARCSTPTCEHSLPAAPQLTFAGWGPSGVPRVVDFAPLRLARHHPRVAELYADRSPLLTLVTGGRELIANLLPAYREQLGGLRVHGQVAAGWYRPRGGVDGGRLVATFQVLSAGHGSRRRFVLHTVGAAADPALLDALQDADGRLPWVEARRWAETTLQEIAAAASSARPPAAAAVEARLSGLLQHFAERLERPHRARQRHTAHGQQRHHAGHRPTRAAVADLRDAPPERVLYDARHETFVVLGPRGRTHVFGSEGKLVTSVRYPAATIDRRQKLGHWRPTSGQQSAALRERVEALVSGDGELDGRAPRA